MRTLVVDDMRLAVDALVKLLRSIDPLGEHTGVTTAAEALAYIEKKPPDVAFLDIEMPGTDGLALARRIREKSHGAGNIVFVTGHSQYALEAHGLFASGYLLKPATREAVVQVLMNLRRPIEPEDDGRLRVQCFGDFEVFSRGKPLHFGRSKAKEMLAYLIDRRGAVCTSGELMAVLWEDRDDTPSLQNQLRNVLAELKRSLAAVGAQDVLLRRANKVGVDCARVKCDYYDFLRGDPVAINQYCGEYMSQYSWAEMTGAVLQEK